MVKNTPSNAGDVRDVVLIHGMGRSLRGGLGNRLQYSCLENPMDRGSGRPQSIGSQRVLCDLSDLACMHAKPTADNERENLNHSHTAGENLKSHSQSNIVCYKVSYTAKHATITGLGNCKHRHYFAENLCSHKHLHT